MNYNNPKINISYKKNFVYKKEDIIRKAAARKNPLPIRKTEPESIPEYHLASHIKRDVKSFKYVM